MKLLRKAVLPLTAVILSIPLLTAVVRSIRLGQGLAGTDIATQFLPWWRFSASAVRAGHLPWWDPSVMCGYPHLADPQSAFFYPLNWLLLLSPSIAMLTALLLLHLALGATGVYLWLRHRGASPDSALILSTVFMAGGGLSAHASAGHFSLICASAYLPLCILLTERWLENDPRAASQLGVCLGIQLLTGHPQTSLLTLIGCLVTALFRLRGSLPRLPVRVRESSWVAALIALIACAPIVLGYELIGQTGRAAASSELVVRDALPPAYLGTMLIPDFSGGRDDVPFTAGVTPHEAFNYVGMTTLVLLLTARRQTWHTSAGLMIAGLCLAILPGIPSIGWHHLPVLGMFRGWARAMILTTLGMLPLAAAGFDRIRAGLASPRRVTGSVAAVWGLMILFAISVNPIGNDPLRSLIRAELVRGTCMLIGTWVGMLALRHSRGSFATPVIAALVVMDLSIGWVSGLAPKPIPDEPVLAMLANDPLMRTVYPPSSRQTGRLLIHSLPESINKTVMLNADTIVGYRPLPLRRYEEFFSVLEGMPPGTPAIYAFTTTRNRLTQLAGLEWRLSLPQDIDPPGLELKGAVGPAQFFRDPKAFPRFRGVSRYAVETDAGTRLRMMADPGRDALNEVVLEETLDMAFGRAGMVPGRLDGRYTDGWGSIEVDIESGDASILVVSDAWYPGWEARVDGRVVPIHRADHLFRAVEIPAGAHVVTMRYVPGWRWSVIGVTGTGLLIGMWLLVRRKPEW
mgnify:CR=1 FL=1